MPKNYIINSISGIWNSLGCPAEVSDGVSVALQDSTDEQHQSLIELCGFSRDEKQIGQIASSKEISELVVMLPMIQSYDTTNVTVAEQFEYLVNPEVVEEVLCEDCREVTCIHNKDLFQEINKNTLPKNVDFNAVHPSLEENAFLFKIKEEIVNKVLGVDNYKDLSIYQIKEILNSKSLELNKSNTIVSTMYAMVNYYIPPHLNWMLNKEIPPIMFYTAEVKHTLDKDDLSSIWQGNMPKISEYAQEEEITIEHFLMDEEMFGGFNIRDMQNVKLSIFKCKKKGSANYDALVKSKEFVPNENWYEYNWPYDNFSLVELIRVDAGSVTDYEDTPESVEGVIKLTV